MARTGPFTVSVSRPRPVVERPVRHRTVIRVRGDQDIANVSALCDALAWATDLGGAVVVDLSRVTFMDASSLGAIVRARHVLEAQARSLIVRSPSPCARRLLDLCGIPALADPEGTTAPARTRATVSRGPGVTAPRSTPTA
jgi:anti-anti-sigma factor